LHRIEDILPKDIRRGSERRHRVKEGVRHPDSEGGIFLSERLSGSDGRDPCHGFRCGSRIDEHILVVRSFACCRQIVAYQFAQPELDKAGEEWRIENGGLRIEDEGLGIENLKSEI